VLRAADLYLVRMPLVQPFAAAHGTIAHKDALLLRAETDHGIGWGECAVLAEPTYEPDTIETCRVALRNDLCGRLPKPAHAARQCAELDARLRAEGVPLASHIGATRAHIEAGVAVGLGADVAPYADAGYRRIKCKIEPGRDLDVIRAARAAAPVVELAADANASYTLDQIATFRALDAFSLQCIEQPFAADDLDAHAELAMQLLTPICLDESVTSLDRARDAVERAACDVIAVKPGRFGGIEPALELAAVGADLLVGGMLETGVGRAVLVALAAHETITMTGDISASDRYFEHDITEPFVLVDGHLEVPPEPGIGRTPIPELLDRYTIEHERITP
jgi:O-succinylbenzoate synthase